MSDPPHSPVRRIRSVLGQHPALALTVGYLVVSLLGISYEWTLFRHFGVNFFHYADVTDVLMGAFREPITFALALSALIVAALGQAHIDWEQRWFAQRQIKSRVLRAFRHLATRASYRLAPIFFFLGYSVMFIWVYSGHSAEAIRADEGERVTVMLADAASSRGALQPVLLGTSSRSVFFFEPDRHVTTIVPNENIAWIRVDAPAVTP